jgi:hypothetical protein
MSLVGFLSAGSDEQHLLLIMRIKGIVERYEGVPKNKIVINLEPRARIRTETQVVGDGTMGIKGDVKYGTAWKNTDFPKVGSIVRINFREKDKK